MLPKLSDACPKAGRRHINAGWLSSGTKRKYTPFRPGRRKLDPKGSPTFIFSVSASLLPPGPPWPPLWTNLAAQPALIDAQAAFYNASFEKAANLALDLCAADDLDACELQLAAALLMEIKRGHRRRERQGRSLRGVREMPGASKPSCAIRAWPSRGARLKANPSDEAAQFLLASSDLNYLAAARHARTEDRLGRVLGSPTRLDAILKHNPQNVRRRSRPRMDRLHRRYTNAQRDPLGAGRRQQETGDGGASRSRQGGHGHLHQRRSPLRLVERARSRKEFPEAVALAHELARTFRPTRICPGSSRRKASHQNPQLISPRRRAQSCRRMSAEKFATDERVDDLPADIMLEPQSRSACGKVSVRPGISTNSPRTRRTSSSNSRKLPRRVN